VMVIGERLNEQTANDIQQVYADVEQALGTTIASELINAFPILRHLPNPAYEGIMSSVALKSSLMAKWIRDDHPDSFIRAMNDMTPTDAEKYRITELKHKVQTIYDFFGAGVVTTRSTLGILINVLVHNVPIQEKLHQEIISTIGDSHPALSDRENMPYHMATLLEINRFASIVPLSIPHKSTRDTAIDVNGTSIPIPAETEILVHLWGLHHDEQFWIKPYEFDPQRFLDDNGELVPADHPNRKHVMAFGAGHRVCVGEVFALSRMFLILANLIQTFRILPETTIEAQTSCDPRDMKYGNVLMPNPYKVRLVPW
jgi:cytochrome P450